MKNFVLRISNGVERTDRFALHVTMRDVTKNPEGDSPNET